MTNYRGMQIQFKYAACLGLLVSGLGVLSPAWADEVTDKADEEKSEQARQEAEEKRAAEEAEIKAGFSYTFNEVSDKIVIIQCTNFDGQRGSGSGFIGVMDGKTYLFTNQHVIMGSPDIEFKTASGEKLHPRGVELSVTRDIVRMPLPDHEGFAISDKPALDIPVAIFGNSEGGGVATELYGKVNGVTADLVEVSADFVPGNSGSPVLNEDKEVIGIASYLRFSSHTESDDEDGKSETETRRFCYRLTDIQWAPVNWKKYNEEYGQEHLDTTALVDSVFEVIVGWGNDPFGYVPRDFKNYDLKKWAKGHNDMVDRIVRLSDKGRATRHELENINEQISNDIADSAEALSIFCERKSRIIQMKLSKRDLTGFLHDDLERQVASLHWASVKIDAIGKKLSTLDYFHFR